MHNPVIKKLKNGLTLLLVPVEGTETVSLIVNVGAGSRFEDNNIIGMTHFLEHIIFDGTKRRPNAIDISREIDAIGADVNAHPTEEYTNYHIKAASEHLDKIVDIISDMLTGSIFADCEIEKEKKVVIEEIKMRSDIPSSYIFQVFDQALFSGTPLARYTGGTVETITKMKRNDVVNFYDKFYFAENVYVCLAGNFSGRSERELEKLIERKFCFKNSSPEVVTVLDYKPKKLEFIAKDSQQTNLAVGFLGPDYSSPDRLATKLLTVILGGNMSSRMFTEIREKKGLAYDIRSFQSSGSDIGSIMTVAGVADEKALEALEAIIREYKRAKIDITEDELKKAKTFLVGQMKLNFEDSYELGDYYLTKFFYQKKIELVSETMEKIAKIKLPDVLAVADKYFDFDNMSIGVIAKEKVRQKIEKLLNNWSRAR
jgi:predicted Zn-dependent peptidase